MALSQTELVVHIRDPLSWLEHADSLLLAAGQLLSALRLSRDQRAPPGDTRLFVLGLVRGQMTLLGAGLECLLKAVAVSRGLLNQSDTRVEFARALRGRNTHDLVAMAKSLSLDLTGPEWSLLKRASEYLSWAGRYPAARRLDRSLSSAKHNTLSLHSTDVELAANFARRIRHEVVSAT